MTPLPHTPTGLIFVAPEDKLLKFVTTMDLKLLKKAIRPFIKSGHPVDIALYPMEKEKEYTLLLRDSFSRGTHTWLAIAPTITYDDMEEL